LRPDQWHNWLNVLKFEWSDVVVPGSCLVGGLKLRILLRGLAPLILLLFPLAISIVMCMISHCRAQIADRTKTLVGEGFKDAVLRALPYVIVISFCLNQSVSAGIFSAWDCVEFMQDSATGAMRQFLREEPSIECETDEHWEIKRVAYVFFAMWPVGVPILYFLMLWPCREALVNGRTTPLTRATSFLHKEYSGQYFWWESLFVLQRVMVTGFSMFFFQAKYTVWRILFGIYITVSYMALLLTFRPYVQRDLNFLAAVGAQFALGCTILNALCIRIFDEIKANSGLQDAQRIMGFDSPSDVSTLRRKVVTSLALGLALSNVL
jgi:hypothetical protein